MMKRRNQLDFGIVDRCGIDFDTGARRQAAEEIDNSAAPHYRQGLLPRGWIASRFNHGIGAESVFGKRSYGGHDIFRLVDVELRNSDKSLGNFELSRAPFQRD